MSVRPGSPAHGFRLESADFGATASQWDDWRWQYVNRLTRPIDLERLPWLGAEEINHTSRVIRSYPYAVTPYFLSLVRWEDPEDPVRKQVLPDVAEICTASKGSLDPLAEQEHTEAPGLIHRYPDRVVVMATHCCAVHCRHCFRKRLWKQPPIENDSSRWDKVIEYLRRHEEIRDVLVSGGDPLTLSDEQLERILSTIRRVRHIEIIRIGSRVPVVLPQRITSGLCRTLERYGPLWCITQFNHPHEITREAARACERLLRSGIPVNNQTVLLRGVNDQAATIKNLCQSLLRICVRPYYLHHCDRVAGTEHFWTPVRKGIEIIGCMQGYTSGLAIPRFMVDLPGKGGKVPLQPDYFVSSKGNQVLLRNYSGKIFRYEDPKWERGIGFRSQDLSSAT